MSVQRGNFPNAGHFYSNVFKPLKIDLNFVVDSTNGNGLGIRSLKSNGYVENVFMRTSATPGTNNGHLNPNPLAGFAFVQLKSNFNIYLGGFSGFVAPVTGSIKIDNSVLVAGQAYVITTVGNSTLAQWQAVGLYKGVTPAVGVPFIATGVGAGANTSTSRVSTPTTSGITSAEVVGDTSLTFNSSVASNSGMYFIVQFMAATSAGVTTLIPTAPANGSVVGMSAFFDGSSVTVDGL